MATAKIDYHNYYITVELPLADDDNTVKIAIERKEGTYDANLFCSDFKQWWQNGQSDNPEDWLGEAVTDSVKLIREYHTHD